MGAPAAPPQQQQQEQRWTPKVLPLNTANSARNNITRKKGDKGRIGNIGLPGYLGGGVVGPNVSTILGG